MPAYRPPSVSTASQQSFANRTFRITHPFHPLKNRAFEIDGVRRLPGECRVFFYNQKGRKTSVPLEWTDIGADDPFVVVSGGRALFRVEDLLGLARLVGELKAGKDR